MEAVNEFLQAAINVVIAMLIILVPLFYRQILDNLLEAWARVSASMPSQVAAAIQFAASMAVSAAEQYANSDQINFQQRKEKAIEIAERWLRHQGYDIDLDVIDDAIESILGEINEEN